jgi:hypothetical protein
MNKKPRVYAKDWNKTYSRVGKFTMTELRVVGISAIRDMISRLFLEIADLFIYLANKTVKNKPRNSLGGFFIGS